MQEAKRMWHGGMPYCASIAQAREEWAVHIPAWVAWMKAGVPHHFGHGERMGWIDEAVFWETFWRTGSKNPCMRLGAFDMKHYLVGAAIADSMTFFETMPEQYYKSMFVILSETRVICSARLFIFLQEHSSAKKESYTKYLEQQRRNWLDIEWCKEKESYLCPPECGMSLGDFILKMTHGIKTHQLDKQAKLQVFGHALMNLPKNIHFSAFMQALREHVYQEGSLDIDIDLDLLFLCSGYGTTQGDPFRIEVMELGQCLIKDNYEINTVSVTGNVFKPRDMLDLYSKARSIMELKKELDHSGNKNGLTFDFSDI